MVHYILTLKNHPTQWQRANQKKTKHPPLKKQQKQNNKNYNNNNNNNKNNKQTNENRNRNGRHLSCDFTKQANWMTMNWILNFVAKSKFAFVGEWTLGIFFGNDNKPCKDINWQARVEKLEKVLNIWSLRDLTLQGRSWLSKLLEYHILMYLAGHIAFL